MTIDPCLCLSLVRTLLAADPAPAAGPVPGAEAASRLAADSAASGPSTFDIVFPLTVLILVGVLIPVGMMYANHVLSRLVHGKGNETPGKNEPYEGGLNTTVGTANERFSVKFYLIAMLFLAFDLEVAFLYPWAVHFKNGGWSMVWLLLIFLVMLEVGYLYLWKKGALDWDR